MEWSARITTISMEMILPALVGYWLDQRWGTRPVFIILGTILGFTIGLMSLIQLTRQPGANRKDNDNEKK